MDSRVILDWFVHDGTSTTMGRQKSHKRIAIDLGHVADVAELTLLTQKMARFVASRQFPRTTIRSGLPWAENAVLAQPVPPSGGEGGEMDPLPEL